MRKINFLFAFLLSMMGATQAWAATYTGAQIKSSWTCSQLGWWGDYGTGIYDYGTERSNSHTIISPVISSSKEGQKISINGYGGHITVDGTTNTLKYSYSTDNGTTWIEIGDITKDLVYNGSTNSHDMAASFRIEEGISYQLKVEVKNIYIASLTIEEFDAKTVFLDATNWDASDGEERFALNYTVDGTQYWTDFNAVEGETNTYSAVFPASASMIIPCRMAVTYYNSNYGTTLAINEWDRKWNQTADITTINDMALYTITNMDGAYTESVYTPLETYTATFTNNAAWSEVYAYAWSGDGDAAVKFLGNYPGTKLTEKNGNVYTLTFKARQQPEHILFSDGTDANKTSDLTFTNGGEYNNGELHTYTATMTFTNDAWDKVYAYAFTGDGDAAKKYLGAWPGTELTAENGVYTVTIEATEAPAYIIFTDNNGQQTDDLVFVDGNAYEVYYKVPGIDLYWTTSTFSLPDEWTYDSAAGWAGYGYATAKGGNMVYAANYWQEHNTNTTSIVTNLVGVSDTNDLLTISAYRWSYASTGEAILNVYKSKDKENWELVKAFNESEIGSSLSELQVSGVEAGNYYFKFEINNVAFDYFYGFSLAKPMTLALDETSTENQVVAGTYDEVTVAFTMQAGKFAAICLPFATTTTALGEGVKAWAFTGYTDGNIDLSTTTELAAATPYIVYAENGINGLTFQNVTIESNEASKVEQGAATFQGSYVKMAAGTMTDKYGVTPAGKIQKAGSGASMKAFRAYFEGITQGAKLVFNGEIIGEATGIDTIENAAQTGELYDLQGRRVMNAQKGLYIQNGKKVVMK